MYSLSTGGSFPVTGELEICGDGEYTVDTVLKMLNCLIFKVASSVLHCMCEKVHRLKVIYVCLPRILSHGSSSRIPA